MMRFVTSILVLLAGILGNLVPAASFASDEIEIVKAEGLVEVKQQDQQAGKAVHTKSILPSKHILTTGPDGRAVVKAGDSGYIVIEKNTTIETDHSAPHANIFRQVTGIIFYAMNSIRGSQRPVQIKTATATLGIRGTRFLVADLPDRKEIGVRKGLISVTSPDEAYEIHRKAQEDEFAAFKKEARDAIDEERRKFSEYQSDIEKEFIEYKHQFELGKDRMVKFDGRKVTESALSSETRKDMESLESYAAEWLKKVRD